MTKQNKKDLYKIIAAGVLFVLGSLYTGSQTVKFFIFAAAFLTVGAEVVLSAARNIAGGQMFDESLLMTIATLGAFIVGEYPEGVAVMLFYQVGELFQNYAVNKSRKSISDLMNIRPDFANLEKDGNIIKTDPNLVKINDIIVVKPGEKIPLDGVILSGSTAVDTSALTGESMPRDLKEGENVLSGCINLSGLIKVKVEKEFADSTVSKILDLVENASGKKSKSEKFITKFARYYTPAVVIFAIFLAVIPPVVLKGGWSDWIYRALIFLVISCPCALVISVPLSFFGGIGGASKAGILVKGSNYLETLAKADTVVFDKTGTLTKGKFEVVQVNPIGISAESLLEIAALAESHSNHPIALSVKSFYGKEIESRRVTDIKEHAGYGITAVLNGEKIAAGNIKLMEQLGISAAAPNTLGTVVYLAKNGNCIGNIVIEDTLKPDAKQAIEQLKNAGVKKTVMLTGDSRNVGEAVASRLGIDITKTQLLPADKVECLENLLQENRNGTLCYVGDGINDAPVLARADVGVAMGALGSDAAIEAADIVIMTDEPSKLAAAIKISRKTVSIAKQNIIFALGVKLLVLMLGAFGIATMWAAVFADVGVAFIAILNAMRALSTKNL